MSYSLCTQYYLCFKCDLASRLACFLSPLVPILSQRSSKRLHYYAKLTSTFLVMASTHIHLLPILSTSGVPLILKKWLSIVSEHNQSHPLHLFHGLLYQRLYQEQFDVVFIKKTSYSRQWNTYTALRVHIFDLTLFHLLSCFFPQTF